MWCINLGASNIHILFICCQNFMVLQEKTPTIPTTVASEIATSRQLSIPRRPDEAATPRPQDVDRTVSQHCEPITVGWIQQPSFPNNSESERERKCNYAVKWKRTISTSAIASEISQSRLEIGCQLTASTRENCPSTISNSNHLGKEA
ncbi:hypothetical protein CR513_49714, partial [Mucuna pruriens]